MPIHGNYMMTCRSCGDKTGCDWETSLCDDCHRIERQGTPHEREMLRRKRMLKENPDFKPVWLNQFPQWQSTVDSKLPCDSATIDQCESWMPTLEKPILLLHARSHLGKSRLAARTAQRLAQAWFTEPIFFAPGEIGTRVASAWSKGGDAIEALVQTVISAPLVFIDDIDKTKPTERAAEFTLQIIKDRVASGRATIITTNAIGSDLETDYGPKYGPPLINELREYSNIISPQPKVR